MSFRVVGSLAGWCGVVLCLAASSLVAASPAGAVAGFGDVAEGRYYTEPVQWSVDNDVAGIDGNCFLPDAPVSRGEAAVYIWNMQGQPSAPAHSFVDVTVESQDAAVSWMSHNEITTGTSTTTFGPDTALNRAHLVTFLWRLANEPAAPDHPFSDVHASWQQGSVSWAADREITTGTSATTFDPDDTLTRAHLVTFLYRYQGEPEVMVDPASPECDPDAEPVAPPAVVVPVDGTAVSVPRGGSFTAELDQVSVDAPAGALSGEAQVSLSVTSVGTGEVPEGEELATAPLALRVTGAEIIRPLTLRFRADASSLTPAGVVPAWYSSELGSWVPLDAQSVVIGDGVVTVTANLADTRPVSAATVLGPTVYAGAGPLNGPVEVALPVIAGVVVVGLIFAVTGLVALTWDVVHDALKRFFGLLASEPECRGDLPAWVDSLSDSEDSLSGGRARLFSCGESAGDDLVVKVVNNRNYGIEFDAASGRTPVELAGGSLPWSGLDLLIKQTAEEVIGGSYLWPLSSSEFRLSEQTRDWSGKWRPTGTTAVVDGIRIGVDLLKIAVPGLSLAEVTQQKLLVCIKNLLREGAKILKGSFDIWNFEHWTKMLTAVTGCFVATGGDSSEQANKTREGFKEVNKALRLVSTVNSAVKWALTAADAVKDSRRIPASIRVSVPDDDQDGITDECDSDQGNDGVTDDPFGRPDLDTDGITDDCDDDRDGDQILDRCESDRDNDGILDRFARDRDNDGIVDYGGCDTDIDFSVVADSQFSEVSAGRSHSCALRTDGTIACWGYNTDEQADNPNGEFSAVSVGNTHSCVLQNLSIDCWGNNDYGQTRVPVGAYTAVSAGSDHTCALQRGGSIKCWGNNSHGQIDAPSGRFTAVSAGDIVSCGVTTDGAVMCWGGAADWSATSTGPFSAVAAGGTNSCALGTDGTITCRLNLGHPLFPGTKPDQPAGTFNALSVNHSHGCGITTQDTITCWGSNPYGRTDAPQGTYLSVSAGHEHSCAVRTDSTITCWGRHSDEQETTGTDTPTPSFQTVSAGERHACGIRADNTITCWGDNVVGQADAPAGAFQTVSAGRWHSCGLRADNTITCWGWNSYGQGDAPAGAFQTVSAGGWHACGLRADNTLICWGANDRGRVDAPAGAFQTVSAGSFHSCGLRADNTLICWGANDYGQADAPSGAFQTVSVGWRHSCGLRADNTLICWGDNETGVLDAPSGAFQTVSSGRGHSCGLRADNTITCWGGNWNGQADAPSGAFQTVSASWFHSCGLRADNTITCWGNNDYGQADAPAAVFQTVSTGQLH